MLAVQSESPLTYGGFCEERCGGEVGDSEGTDTHNRIEGAARVFWEGKLHLRVSPFQATGGRDSKDA